MLAFRPFAACSVSSKPCSFIRRSLAREIPVRRFSSARLTFSSENLSPCSAIICSMAFATTGDMAAKLGCFILSPFTGGWLRLQCKGTIQIVNGCFQLTKIGVFRLTRNGNYRLTLTPEHVPYCCIIGENLILFHISLVQKAQQLSPWG